MLFHMVALNLLLTVALITAYSEDFGWLLKNFRPFRKWLQKLPRERVFKTVTETGDKSDPEICVWPPTEKTNSACCLLLKCYVIS